ncbi:MAG: lactonase family protein [Devosia sp.]|nr:lactonase family protein [Devosia sp.]
MRTSPHPQAPAAISVFRLDEASGRLTPLEAVGGIDNPTWLAVDARRRRLYAASEVVEWAEGTVSAYDIEPASGRLSYLNKQPTLGNSTCHLGLSPDGRFLAAANYADDGRGPRPDQSLALFLPGEGELAPSLARAKHEGRGADPGRQARPHAHCALFTPDSRHLFIADLGLDRLCAYRLDERGELMAAPERDVVFAPGQGPRHIALHPDGRRLFVVHELHPGISVVVLEGEQVRLRSTYDFGYPQQVYPAAIMVSPDGRHVYASVRVCGEIIGFAVGPDDQLSEIGRWPCGGATPRDARLSPSGSHLVVANQDAGTVVVLRRDASSGELVEKTDEVPLPAPMCVTFFAAAEAG